MNDQFSGPDVWIDFDYHRRMVNRYFLSDKHQQFLNLLVKKAESRRKVVPKQSIYYRARVGHISRKQKSSIRKKDYPFPRTKMLNPEPRHTIEGRINPRGISYLYLANDVETAVAEKKPQISQLVSIAKIVMERDVNVVDVRSDEDWLKLPMSWDKDAPPDRIEARIWWDIDRAFATPITGDGLELDYIATQYLGEVLKNNGYEGILYRSSLMEGGHNLVLFAPHHSIKVESVNLVRAKGITYKIEKYRNY